MVQDHLQFWHLLKIINPLEIFHQQAVFLIIRRDKINHQQLIFILELSLRGIFASWRILPHYSLPNAFYLVDGCVEGKNAVVLWDDKIIVENLGHTSGKISFRWQFLQQFEVCLFSFFNSVLIFSKGLSKFLNPILRLPELYPIVEIKHIFPKNKMFLDILILHNKLPQHYKFKNNSGSLLMHTANSIHQPK